MTEDLAHRERESESERERERERERLCVCGTEDLREASSPIAEFFSSSSSTSSSSCRLVEIKHMCSI